VCKILKSSTLSTTSYSLIPMKQMLFPCILFFFTKYTSSHLPRSSNGQMLVKWVIPKTQMSSVNFNKDLKFSHQTTKHRLLKVCTLLWTSTISQQELQKTKSDMSPSLLQFKLLILFHLIFDLKSSLMFLQNLILKWTVNNKLHAFIQLHHLK